MDNRFVVKLFAEARACGPSIIFWDEVDGLLGRPSPTDSGLITRLQSTIKAEWAIKDQDASKVIVIGATNRPWDLVMEGFGRRFQRKLFVGLPDKTGRQDIISEQLAEAFHTLQPRDFKYLAEHTDGLTGAELISKIQQLIEDRISWVEWTRWFKKVCGASHCKPIH